jgi:flagellar biosynthesis/type III secretory pathway protein FliH
LTAHNNIRQDEPAAATCGGPGNGTANFVRFEYPESTSAVFVPTWEGWDDPAAASAFDEAGAQHSASTGFSSSDERAENPADSESPDAESRPQASVPDLARLLGEERERAFEAGRRKGIEEGREAAHAIEAQSEERRIAQVTRALEGFAGERDRYLKAVEHEVVKLALAVAARILRREAEVDPLLLSGAVRVALGQIAASTEVRLRVPDAELAMWKEAMTAVPNLATRPAVIAGEGMQLGDCDLETALGKADLGISAQLAEVERVLLVGSAAVGASVSRAPNQEKLVRESAA